MAWKCMPRLGDDRDVAARDLLLAALGHLFYYDGWLLTWIKTASAQNRAASLYGVEMKVTNDRWRDTAA